MQSKDACKEEILKVSRVQAETNQQESGFQIITVRNNDYDN